MIHLTEKEMDEFIALGEAQRPDFELARRVNAHLLECKQCRERVAARQDAYDAAHPLPIRKSQSTIGRP